jgi:hypothetical protein
MEDEETAGKTWDFMNHFYFIYEKNGRDKLLSLLRGKRIALAALKRFAARTSHEVYLQDVQSHQVIAIRNG